MPQLLWDASALIKRYTPEAGSDAVDAVFTAVAAPMMLTTFLCYAETCGAIRRKLNRGSIDIASFTVARSSLQSEILDDPDFRLLSIGSGDFLAGVTLTDQHNLNSSDAGILATYLRYSRAQPPGAPTCLLISADQRFLRAADAEGLRVLNPELIAAADVPTFLASL